MPADDRAAFTALFETHFDAILAYARRRTRQLSDAEDVVAETFIVAWRRFDRLPQSEQERLPWLYGVARRVLANQRRGTARRLRLTERLRAAAKSRALSPAVDVLEAVVSLPAIDQEILRLVAWEGLSHAEVGIALGITANAAAIRLHRARRRLSSVMKGSGPMRTWPAWKGGSDTGKREES